MSRKKWKKQRRGRVLLAAITLMTMAVTACGSGSDSGVDANKEPQPTPNNLEEGEVAVPKSPYTNPMVGNSETGEYTYGGDPSVLVDGDTVYLYTGHDISTDSEAARAVYNIPEYLCYSTTDMVNWKAEGSVMKADKATISWANTSTSAWASQVTKYKDKYYLYFCTWDMGASGGKQSIGVAVADSPTGPFKDIGKSLVNGDLTEPQSNNWNDIDPTVWVDTDDKGNEHRYLAWGNSKFYICELNEDMISIKDINGDGEITCGSSSSGADILNNQMGLGSFTEAPWLYRRKDSEGKTYGDYYLFYAYGWRERMAYSTTADPMKGGWKLGKVLMEPTATSNTNHMAVFDFKGKTYFVYHNGSLPAGNGYRRSACITELTFHEDGSVEPMLETASGPNGTTAVIKTSDGKVISHPNYINSGVDTPYPYNEENAKKDVQIGVELSKTEADGQWVITGGKADYSKDAYVSIQAENKPGLYWTVNKDGTITMAQDYDTQKMKSTAKKQTFHTVKALNGGEGVSFESVSEPGKYVTVQKDKLILSDGKDKEAATFLVE